MKEKVYNIIANSGIWFLSKFFPEYFVSEPLKPTDRWIEYPFVLERLPRFPCTILDVGCSGSMFPLLLKTFRHRIYGVDIRPYQFNKDIIFMQQDICSTPFFNNYFDVITAISTIEHIGLKGKYGAKETSTDTKAITEIHRILKPNGMFFMTVPYGKNYVTKYHRIYDKRTLDTLLTGFNYFFHKVKSPETDYDLALIQAVK